MTITLKNVPPELHAKLKDAAARHRRSLNNEALMTLATGLARQRLTVEEKLDLVRSTRAMLGDRQLDPAFIDECIREVRE